MNTLIFLLLTLPLARPIPTPVPTPTRPPIIQEVKVSDPLVDLVNITRASSGCKTPLKINSDLTKAAQERAIWVADNHWTHDGWKETVGKYYRYWTAGENLARDYANNESMIKAWLDSEKHRDNLLNCKFRDTGIGRSGSVVVQLFGSR